MELVTINLTNIITLLLLEIEQKKYLVVINKILFLAPIYSSTRNFFVFINILLMNSFLIIFFVSLLSISLFYTIEINANLSLIIISDIYKFGKRSELRISQRRKPKRTSKKVQRIRTSKKEKIRTSKVTYLWRFAFLT